MLKLVGDFNAHICVGNFLDSRNFLVYYNPEEGILQSFAIMQLDVMYRCPMDPSGSLYQINIALPDRDLVEIKIPAWGWIPAQDQSQSSGGTIEEDAVGFYTLKINKKNQVTIVEPTWIPALKNSVKNSIVMNRQEIFFEALKTEKDARNKGTNKNPQVQVASMVASDATELKPQFLLQEFALKKIIDIDRESIKNESLFKLEGIFVGASHCEKDRFLSHFHEWEKKIRFYCLKELPYQSPSRKRFELRAGLSHHLYENEKNQFSIPSTKKGAGFDFNFEPTVK